MSKGAGAMRQIPQVDPQKVIQQEQQLNRLNTYTPFGSQTYETGPDGRTSFNTTLSPEMQSLVSGLLGKAGQSAERYKQPEYMADMRNRLAQAYMSRRFPGG